MRTYPHGGPNDGAADGGDASDWIVPSARH